MSMRTVEAQIRITMEGAELLPSGKIKVPYRRPFTECLVTLGYFKETTYYNRVGGIVEPSDICTGPAECLPAYIICDNPE